MIISVIITFPTSRSSPSLRVSPPSNNNRATEKETIGRSRSPKRASGLRNPVIGPAINPITRKNNIDGNLSLHDSHCAAMPSIIILASSIKIFSLSLFSLLVG